MKDAIGQYLDQIGTVQLLDKEREIELAQRIEAGRDAQRRLDAGERGADLARAVRDGASAKDHFIRANLRLVVSLARRYPLPPAMDLGDLIQEGNIGLEHAVDKFDWRRGFKFSTYATFWIRQAIGRALDQKASLLRASGGSQEDLDAELAALHLLTTPTSIDRPIGDGDGTEFGDLLADRAEGPEQVVVERMHEESVVALLDRLEPRARRAVQLRLGLDDGRRRSLREVGDEIGVSAEAARRMVERALDQLKVEAGALGLAAA
jgi:RNA polymerase primary sigma factor